jgi:hypothetical protein
VLNTSPHREVDSISACLLGYVAIHKLEGLDNPLHYGPVHRLLMLLECCPDLIDNISELVFDSDDDEFLDPQHDFFRDCVDELLVAEGVCCFILGSGEL